MHDWTRTNDPLDIEQEQSQSQPLFINTISVFATLINSAEQLQLYSQSVKVERF